MHEVDGPTKIYDEVHTVAGSETGKPDVISQLRYAFNPDGQLTGYDPNPTLSSHMQQMVGMMAEFVHIPGSTISASNHNVGCESNFVSDGTQWIEAQSGDPAPTFRGRHRQSSPQLASWRVVVGSD